MSIAIKQPEPEFDFLFTTRDGEIENSLVWSGNRLRGKVRLISGEAIYSMCHDGQWVPDHDIETVDEISADDFDLEIEHEDGRFPARITIDLNDMIAFVRQDFSC